MLPFDLGLETHRPAVAYRLVHEYQRRALEPERASMVMRALWTFVWFSIVAVGTNAYGSWSVWSGFNIVGPLITLLGLLGMGAVWVVPVKHHRALEHVSFSAAILAVLLAEGPVLVAARFFGTDSAAFNQRATELLVSGKNPYTATFHPAGLLLDHANDFWTYTLGGGYVDKVSYPAGSFLLQAPLQVLGLHHLGTNWLDLFAWIAAAIILYLVSPWYAKWLAPLLLLASMFTYMFTFGGTDALFVPFMMLAALSWDNFVIPTSHRWAKWVGPVSLGIACSIKQTPWFTVPFFVAGIAIESRHLNVPVLRTVARYCAHVAGAFLAINLPFIIWSPAAWLHGVLLPMAQPLIPEGQGLVSLVTHGALHVVHPLDLQLASLFAMVALLAGFYFWYPPLKRSWMFAIPLILFLPSRSLSSYLVDFIPAAFVMALTTHHVPQDWMSNGKPLLHRWAVGVPAALSVVTMIFAFSSPPVGIHIDHYGSSADNQYMSDMTVTLTNYTNSPIVPHIMVLVGSGHPTGFWRPTNGSQQLTLQAHAQVTVTLEPPKYMGAPNYHESWLVDVLTKSPAALTTTPVFTWQRGHRIN